LDLFSPIPDISPFANLVIKGQSKTKSKRILEYEINDPSFGFSEEGTLNEDYVIDGISRKLSGICIEFIQ